MLRAFLLLILVGSALCRWSQYSDEEDNSIWTQEAFETRDLRSVFDTIVRAAEACQLRAYITRVGDTYMQRALGALDKAEAERYTAFIRQKLQAEADGTCARN